MKKSLFLLPVLLVLTACSGLLPSLAGSPPALYELQAPTHIDTSVPVVTKQLLIDVPVSSAGIDTPRMAVIQPDGTMSYYKNVSWTDRAPLMFQTLLVDSFGNSGKLPAVGRENVGLRADYLLKVDLADFQAVYADTKGATPKVRVSLNAKLIVMPRRIIVAGNVFSSEVTAADDSVSAVKAAFQQASDTALSDLVVWTLGQLAEPPRTRR